MLVKVDGEFARDFVFDYHGMAEQAANHRATQAIFIRKLIPTHGCEAAFGDSLFPRRNIAIILRVGTLNTADGDNTNAVEVCACSGGVALIVTAQRAVSMGNAELVACFCELDDA